MRSDRRAAENREMGGPHRIDHSDIGRCLARRPAHPMCASEIRNINTAATRKSVGVFIS